MARDQEQLFLRGRLQLLLSQNYCWRMSLETDSSHAGLGLFFFTGVKFTGDEKQYSLVLLLLLRQRLPPLSFALHGCTGFRDILTFAITIMSKTIIISTVEVDVEEKCVKRH